MLFKVKAIIFGGNFLVAIFFSLSRSAMTYIIQSTAAAAAGANFFKGANFLVDKMDISHANVQLAASYNSA